jgi:pyruvate formate lyase activating enzyme
MRCLYCYNPDIVNGKGKLSYDDALGFLERRIGLLDGVVLSGGECMLHKNLPGFITQVKECGFKIKIDTNGSAPAQLDKLVTSGLVDYVALDFKAMPNAFRRITESNLFGKFEKSLSLLIQHGIGFEVRTTVHSSLLSRNDLAEMATYLESKGYSGNFYIQNFVNDTPTLSNIGPSGRKLVTSDFDFNKINIIVRE